MSFEDAGVQSRIEGILAAEEADEEAAFDEGSADAEEPNDDAGQAEAEADDEAEAEAKTDDEVEDEAEEDESDGPAEIEIEIDGQSIRLTPDEVKAGYLRASDYTRKTQEVARDREAIAEERKAFEAQRQQAYQQFEQELQILASLQEQEPDWERIADEDPLGYQKQRVAWDKKQAARNSLIQEHRRRAAAQQQQTAAERQKALRQQAEMLPTLVPEWKDPVAMQKGQAELRQALIDDGFPAQAVDSIGDARLVRWLLDAKRYRDGEKATAKTEIVKKKVAAKPKVVKPGTTPKGNPQRSAEKSALAKARQSQRPQDWTNAFMKFVS